MGMPMIKMFSQRVWVDLGSQDDHKDWDDNEHDYDYDCVDNIVIMVIKTIHDDVGDENYGTFL